MKRLIEVYYTNTDGKKTSCKVPDIEYCPHCSCQYQAEYFESTIIREESKIKCLEVAFQCRYCEHLFIARYKRQKDRKHKLILLGPVTTSVHFHEDNVLQLISPNFIKIYNESLIAYRSGLNNICGAGFRKAIEYLVKDYLIYNKISSNEKIIKLTLSQAIDKIDLPKIKNLFRLSTWIGNDFVHYHSKLDNYSIDELINFIETVIHEINAEHIYQIALKEIESKSKK